MAYEQYTDMKWVLVLLLKRPFWISLTHARQITIKRLKIHVAAALSAK
jgi:hypothetical protein